MKLKFGSKFLLLIILFQFANELSWAQERAPEPPPGFLAGQVSNPSISPEPGLLFYLSGENGTTADFAQGGQLLPNYVSDIRLISDGAAGQALELDDSMFLTYWAPGNIYAQRGTLSFFWRSRYPVGPTEFPVFRVAFADHTSHDMTWLRIDYNGSGFDAFVTDVGLARTRLSHYMDSFPEPDEWTHVAISWDETKGIRFYIDGKLVEKKMVTGMVYDTGLDQFGPHSRVISPHAVRNNYSFMRAGDLDEFRIHDRMLSDKNISELYRGEIPKEIPGLNRDLSERRWRDAWWTRHGWNLPNEAPPLLTSASTSIRKVEIHDAIDIKRWQWKANDGIRETTWPGVYNKSRLPGRLDYFVKPDWDTYSGAGQTIRFHLPEEEQWNHVEMWGKAWGQLTHESNHPYDHTFTVRSRNQIKSYHRLEQAKQGGIIRFDNALIEEPIGSFTVYHVEPGNAPAGRESKTFTLHPATDIADISLERIKAFVLGRYPADERSMMVGVRDGENRPPPNSDHLPKQTQPMIHIMLPYSDHSDAGLDGVILELPPLDVVPTHEGMFPLNVRVKDPLWEMRDLLDFSFSIQPGEAQTLWLDTRDRILPEGRGLYLTLAGAGEDLTPQLLEGAKLQLIYKSREEVLVEHEQDRFTQIRDVHANNSEASPRTPRLNNYNRFYADTQDLLKAIPGHWLAQAYWYWTSRDRADRPEYKIDEVPDGVPEWAHLQVEHIRQLERIAMYYIDERQISNGEFGGGLNDDGKYTFSFPPLAYFGAQPDKIKSSMLLHSEAYYDRDHYETPLKQRSLPIITNGLSTIQSDELHSYEDGIQVIGQLLLFDYGNPLYFNSGMETAKRLLEDITQIGPDGNRRFRSRYYSGTRIAEEDPWQWAVSNSYIMLHPALLVVRHNGNPLIQQMIIELADGLLEYIDDNGNLYSEIHFTTGDYRGNPQLGGAWLVFQAAYDYTGDEKYLEPVRGKIDTFREFDPNQLAKQYREKVENLGVREYISTEGSIWIDRVPVRSTGWLQEHRLGGVAVESAQNSYPYHRVSWEFPEPATYASLAIFIPKGNKKNIDIIAYNLDPDPVKAEMTTWEIEPGRWRVRQGLDTNGDQKIDVDLSERIVDLQRGEKFDLLFEPRVHTIINLELIEPSDTDYWERPDLGINPNDVKIDGNQITVRIYSMGAVNTPPTIIELKDAAGAHVATASVPELETPMDLVPKWVDITLSVKEGIDLTHGSVQIDPEEKIQQITRRNTFVEW